MPRKEKKKVIGEFFDDDRIRTFLNSQPPAGVDADFHMLERAYRGMQPENFATFVEFFLQDGHNLHATNPDGKTLEELVAGHAASEEYLEILQRYSR